MKIDQFLTAVKIAIDVFRSLASGKVVKRLDQADDAVEIAKAVKKMLKGKK